MDDSQWWIGSRIRTSIVMMIEEIRSSEGYDISRLGVYHREIYVKPKKRGPF